MIGLQCSCKCGNTTTTVIPYYSFNFKEFKCPKCRKWPDSVLFINITQEGRKTYPATSSAEPK